MVSDPEMESVGKCIISTQITTGVMTVRGCAYAGSKGVVFGPIRIWPISHWTGRLRPVFPRRTTQLLHRGQRRR